MTIASDGLSMIGCPLSPPELEAGAKPLPDVGIDPPSIHEPIRRRAGLSQAWPRTLAPDRGARPR